MENSKGQVDDWEDVDDWQDADAAPAAKPFTAPEEFGAGPVADMIGQGLEGISDFVRQVPQKIPLISPLAQSAAAGITAALDPNATYEDNMRKINAGVAARDEQSPIAGVASDVAGAVIAPGANIAGLPGVGASLAVSAADQVAKRDLKGQDISDEDMANNLGLESLAGLGGAALGKGASKILDSDMYRSLAQKYAKKTLGGTKGQLEKLEVKSNALNDSVDRLLDNEEVFNTPFQSKEELYGKILERRRQSGQAGQEIFEAGASPANQAESYERLMGKARQATNQGQAEVANKLSREADILKNIDSNPLPNIGPRDKAAEMAATELDPNIIKGRKTQLDEQAYGNKLQVDKNAAEAAGEVRNMQYDLMQGEDGFLRAENARYGDLLNAEKLSSKAAAGEIANSGGLISTVKKGVGGTVGALVGSAFGPVGTVVGGAIGASGQALLDNYGPQLATYGFNQTSKVLKNAGWAKTLKEAADRGGVAGVGTAHFLLTQRDPSYRQAYQEDQDESKNK